MSTAAPSTGAPGKPAKRTDFAPAKVAINHQHLSLRISDTLTERYSLVYLPPADPMSTACWHYERGGGGSPARHIITFGANLANHKREGCDLGDYAKAYHRHEAAHSLWTERDLRSLNDACGKAGVPFELLNLFEDARIEHKWREDFSERFEWSHYEEIKPIDGKAELAERAAGAFQAMIQCEADEDLLAEALKDVPEAKEIREQFYDVAIKAPNARALIPLMKDFASKYGLPKNLNQSTGGARATAGDMTAGLKVATDAKVKAKLLNSEDPAKKEIHGSQGLPGATYASKAQGGVLCDRAQDTLDLALVQRLVKIFQGVFRTGPQRYKRESPSKRISMRDFILDRTKIYRATEPTAPFRSKSVVVFDCSGSMGGEPARGGRHLVAALGFLARANIIEGDLILSVIPSGARGGIARSQKIPLRSVTPELATKIGAYGGAEGLANAMDSNKPAILEADTALIYTDGAICDQPIDRSVWHRRGVFTIGCYVGAPAAAARLHEWFDAALCRSKIENLAFAIAETMKRKASIRNRIASGHRVEPVTTGTVTRAAEFEASSASRAAVAEEGYGV